MSTVALSRPGWVALLLLGASAILVWTGGPLKARKPSADAGNSRQAVAVALAFGSWQGKPLAVTDRVVEILETDAVASVEYRRGGEPPVWLAQVAGFGNRAAFHPPEICYVGSHFEVMERGPVAVDVHGSPRHLMRLVIRQEQQYYEAWYWFTAGRRVTPSYYRQQLWLLTDTLLGKAASGTLVRISTPLDSPQACRQRLADFLADWEAAGAGGG